MIQLYRYTRYVVTAINNLTGERVVVSMPMDTKDDALRISKNLTSTRAAAAYSKPSVELYQGFQLTIDFEDNGKGK